MIETYEIQTSSGKTINSVSQDNYLKLGLSTSQKEILPYDQNSTVNVTDLFDQERQATKVYRIYGYINISSLINGLSLTYGLVSDFFKHPKVGDELIGQTKNITNSFDVYICRQWTSNTHFTGNSYQRKYQILTNLNDVDFYKSGIAKTIYYEQVFSFNSKIDFDMYGLYDSFGKPIVDLFLYFNYKTSGTESVRHKTFDVNSNESTNNLAARPYVVHAAGDIIDGDLVYYDVNNYEEILMNQEEYLVKLPCKNDVLANTWLEFKYFPFVRVPLQYFNSETSTGNISGTTETDFNIPDHAVKLDIYDNYIWKELLPYGFIDPLTGDGVNHSFVNQRHYVFSEVVLDIPANLNDVTTSSNLSNIIFQPNANIKNNPNNLDKFGNKC